MTSSIIPIVHVVDDDDDLREAVAVLLRVAGYQVRTYADAGHFLLSDATRAPGCLLLDVRMPGGPSGLDLQEALAERRSPLPVIFLSGQADVPMCARAFKAGALDFLTKPIRKDELLAAVARAIERDRETRRASERASDVRCLFESLSERERSVVAGLASGKLNKTIAADLSLSERMVKTYRARIMQKLGIRSISQLIELLKQPAGAS
ncbi:two component LuxR family transcriptional regulator [Caballeronia terrestris]|uniref:Two component LuxR family transcriptional regulator n=1 Tax=Caballeronia terrestris TaxID=1226301 RepID=A0A158JT95_9BURK|nr:response regulator [Caballeronia terrestris]SAL72027.1 two component LuxR family transcriptional regulator [Caballeronia terrestris]